MTAAAVLDLQRAGFTEEQVRALAAFIDSQAATKQDIAELRGELRAMELRLTLRFGAMIAAGVAITVALVKLL